ncbi:MAG: 1-acyl-sn-glycerol-3-phosphate acyltransferase [Planctomycetia bacterium]|nr:1-acyl-sn-glycerol-3-phosphate acyltransferase [Planctomycetia bacterium]
MTEPDWPQVKRDRQTALAVACALCLALPTIALLVLDHLDEQAKRAGGLWLVGSAVAGALVPLVYWSGYRVLGLVPLAAVCWLAAVAHGVYWNEWPGWAHGLSLGVLVGALVRARRGREPLWESLTLFGAVPVGLGVVAIFISRGRPFDIAGWFVLVVAVALVIWVWVRLLRPVLELAVEPIAWVMYRIRGTGPGLKDFPLTGPCIVIANHACWLDPFFLAKVIPRPITPIMISRFYDLPVIRTLVKVVGAIRVPEKSFKKEAPEIDEAIAALDRGDCVVIFPEGYVRRSPDRMLRRFGRGIWRMLKARPNTPVFAAWIEGGWGSFTSHFGGPPMKQKKLDFRRPISVGISAAITLPPELLEDHLRTRLHLMNLVSEARTYLDLPPLPAFELATKPDEPEGEKEGE